MKPKPQQLSPADAYAQALVNYGNAVRALETASNAEMMALMVYEANPTDANAEALGLAAAAVDTAQQAVDSTYAALQAARLVYRQSGGGNQ